MYPIDHATAALARPAAQPAGTQGYFDPGDPGVGRAATVVTADWLNGLQGSLTYLFANVAPAVVPVKGAAGDGDLHTAITRLADARITARFGQGIAAAQVATAAYKGWGGSNAQALFEILYDNKVETTRQILAGAGLSGGGDLSANRTLAVSFAGSGVASTVARSDHGHGASAVTFAPIGGIAQTDTQGAVAALDQRHAATAAALSVVQQWRPRPILLTAQAASGASGPAYPGPGWTRVALNSISAPWGGGYAAVDGAAAVLLAAGVYRIEATVALRQDSGQAQLRWRNVTAGVDHLYGLSTRLDGDTSNSEWLNLKGWFSAPGGQSFELALWTSKNSSALIAAASGAPEIWAAVNLLYLGA